MKKFVSIVMAFLITLLSTANVYAISFPDMPTNASKEALQAAVDNGLIIGIDGKIVPNGYATRAQAATIIVRAFKAEKEISLDNYSDMSINSWYYDEMSKAVQMKIMQGSGNKLNPEKLITREEVCVVIARAMLLSSAAVAVSADVAALDKYTDKDKISIWAKGSVIALTNLGYVIGFGGKFNPRATITRADFAQIMFNIIKTYISKEGTYSTGFNGNVMINVPGVTIKGITLESDLIIGDGVGDGDVVIDNSKLMGRVVVRSGNIKLIGNSQAESFIIAQPTGSVSLVAESNSYIKNVTISGDGPVILTGKIGTLNILSNNPSITLQGAEITNVNILKKNVKINMYNSKIDNLVVTQDSGNVEIILDKDSLIINKTINENAKNVNIIYPPITGGSSGGSSTVSKVTITATANPTTGGTVSGGSKVNVNTSVTLTATANTNYMFINWTKGGAVVSTSASYTFVAKVSGTYTANFAVIPPQQATIIAQADPIVGGTVTGGATVDINSSVTLTATANTNYMFINWTKDGVVVSTSPSYTFVATESGNYLANFISGVYVNSIRVTFNAKYSDMVEQTIIFKETYANDTKIYDFAKTTIIANQDLIKQFAAKYAEELFSRKGYLENISVNGNAITTDLGWAEFASIFNLSPDMRPPALDSSLEIYKNYAVMMKDRILNADIERVKQFLRDFITNVDNGTITVTPELAFKLTTNGQEFLDPVSAYNYLKTLMGINTNPIDIDEIKNITIDQFFDKIGGEATLTLGDALITVKIERVPEFEPNF